MIKTLRGLDELKPDPEVFCDNCGENVATLVGLTYRGTTFEPPEYIQLCEECAGSASDD